LRKQLSKDFYADEFECPDSGLMNMDPEFIKLLQRIRTTANIPFTITSGSRSPAHNFEVGGKPNSAHLRGLAVDIEALTSKARFTIIDSALLYGIPRIGVGKTFVHLDDDDSLPVGVIWIY